MKAEEVKVIELQNKVKQNKDELTEMKLDTVIDGQDYAETTADTRAQNAETKADERAEVSSASHERREVRWKKRFAYAIAGGVALLVLVYSSFVREMQRRDSIADNEIKVVNQKLAKLQAEYQESSNQIKHGVKERLDTLKVENRFLKKQHLKNLNVIAQFTQDLVEDKMMHEAHQTIAENIVPMNLQQYVGVANDTQWTWYASMASQRNAYNVIYTIANISEIMEIEAVSEVVNSYIEDHERNNSMMSSVKNKKKTEKLNGSYNNK
jgi:hypothetical protein